MWIYHKSYPLCRRKAIPHVVFQGRQLSYKSACTTSCKRQVNSFQFSITHCEPELCSIQLFKAAKKKTLWKSAVNLECSLTPLPLHTPLNWTKKKRTNHFNGEATSRCFLEANTFSKLNPAQQLLNFYGYQVWLLWQAAGWNNHLHSLWWKNITLA